MGAIAGAFHLKRDRIPGLDRRLEVQNELQRHRGRENAGIWLHRDGIGGFAYRGAFAEDGGEAAGAFGTRVCCDGALYNAGGLRTEIGGIFETADDAEVILKAYWKWGEDCVRHLDGMFAFALWDAQKQKLFCGRDRFGIKPFYYAVEDGVFYFASEMKALLPFLPAVETDLDGFKDYLCFQFCLDGKTMFKGIRELRSAHTLSAENGDISVRRYWQIYYRLDLAHTQLYFEERLREMLEDSVKAQLSEGVPAGVYVSGGVDSSIVASIARDTCGSLVGFVGKFSLGPAYDESRYAELLAREKDFPLYQLDITAKDFIGNIENVIYHLDTPVAGPGSFSQYMVSGLAARHRKVVLGGQGGDEIFGGYARYLVAYLEQSLKGAIDETADDERHIVTLSSVLPNLSALQQYKPMLKEFWSRGLFEDGDRRYYQLINRAPKLGAEVRWDKLGDYQPFESFQRLFNAPNVEVESYLDRMTHFDFKTQLPALLQVEDRMSMAHGIEARVPFLDYRLVELVAEIPAMMKFKGGRMKYILRKAMKRYVPDAIMNRKDKMGFPTPFNEWAKGGTKEFILDILSSQKALQRDLTDNRAVAESIGKEGNFTRNLWGMFCIELWHRQFHDRADAYRRMLRES